MLTTLQPDSFFAVHGSRVGIHKEHGLEGGGGSGGADLARGSSALEHARLTSRLGFRAVSGSENGCSCLCMCVCPHVYGRFKIHKCMYVSTRKVTHI